MTTAQSPESFMGRTAVDPQGDKIGKIGQVYVDDVTGQPDWVTVNTGLFGTKEHFAPLQGASVTGDDVVLPFDKNVVKDAPDVADASHLDPDEQDALYTYYAQYLTGSGTSGYTETTGTADYSETSGTAGYTESAGTTGTADYAETSGTRSEGYDTSGPTTDDAMTRSEEHLNVGTQRVEAGRARLRKYVVTEQQTVSVPVSHEEVRIEREPITDANIGNALDGPAISEEEHEVVLHAEQPVVTTEAVPVERVRLGTETVSETQQVTGQVRKEEVEVVDDTSSPTSTTGTTTGAENR
jgi:uncharacterized protein (TIGR02271 family)